jgi:hypothetical protein
MIRHEMSAEDGAHAHCLAGALELDRTIDSVGVGTGEYPESTLRSRLCQHLGARDAESE